ncbi:Acetylcholine receptor subunit beta-like 1 [Bulinus truncatus]|nr:Acetylcholine receptor subunit beta-like 1 [Bulinus truncatus]
MSSFLIKLKYCFIIWSTYSVLAQPNSYLDTMSLFNDKINSSNYDPRIRPIIDQSHVIYVGVGFELVSIVDIDDVTQSFTANGFFLLKWFDELLIWDPSNYGGVNVMHPLPEDIWRPRVVLMNTMGDRDLFADDKAPVFVARDGLISWAPGSLFPASCQLDVSKYPFDEQTCVIKIVAMTHSKEEMLFSATNSTIQTHFFITHGEWDLTSATISITEVMPGGANMSTIDLIFVLKRRPAFFVINILLPIVFLSFLNLMVFVIPADSGEKVSYGITVLLSLSVFLSTVSSMLPMSSINMAKLTIYLFILLIISMLTVIDSIIIVFLANMEGKTTRHEKAKGNYKTAVSKTSLLRRVITSLFSSTNNKVETLGVPNKTPIMRLSSVDENKTAPELVDNVHSTQGSGVKSEELPVNRYKMIGKHIDMVSFIVFLLVWLFATGGFLIYIAYGST